MGEMLNQPSHIGYFGADLYATLQIITSSFCFIVGVFTRESYGLIGYGRTLSLFIVYQYLWAISLHIFNNVSLFLR